MTKRPDQTPKARYEAYEVPPDPERAANDDGAQVRATSAGLTGGWDPYEIWASRVRDPRARVKTPRS